MAKGSVVINEQLCQGCGLCVEYCKRGCLILSPQKLSAMGLPQAYLAEPDKCTACCVCAWMCPDYAIEVYKYIEAPA